MYSNLHLIDNSIPVLSKIATFVGDTCTQQRRYVAINIPCDRCAYQYASSWTCPHNIVAVLKLKTYGNPLSDPSLISVV